MQRISWMTVALLACVGEAFAGLPRGWTDDFDAAKRRAAANDRKILLMFSGSDWCGWCKKFDADILSKPDFVKSASRKFELVMIDSPKNKAILSAKAKKQNPNLVSQYDVRGYPSYVITDAAGVEIVRASGYVKGGPQAFLSKLDDMISAAPSKKPVPPAADDQIERQVASWTVFSKDGELAVKVGETAAFLEAVLEVFDEETAGYYRTMASWYDGILLHRDMEQRGKRDLFVKGKRYLNLYASDSLRTWSWCSLFCGTFLSRCRKEPFPDKDRDAMLLYVTARVAKRLEIDGGARRLDRFAAEANGMGRVLHELCRLDDSAIRRYYAAKVMLCETGRFGAYVSYADMAEIFSGVLKRDAFAVFQKYHKPVRKEDVTTRLRGFAEE